MSILQESGSNKERWREREDQLVDRGRGDYRKGEV